MDWNRRYLVVGMARSGVSAALALWNKGAEVYVNDRRTEEAFGGELDSLRKDGIHFALGQEPMDLLPRVDALVISPGVPIDAPFVIRAKELGLEVLGELELGYLLCKASVMALTGTNGKTTTVSLLGDILKRAGLKAPVVGNVGTPITQEAPGLTGEDWAVVEVSSFQLESIHAFHPKVAAILNVTEDHLNRHGDMATYIRMKARIFENQGPEDALILNADDPAVLEMAKRTAAKIYLFSRTHFVEQGAYVKDGRIVFRRDGREEDILAAGEVFIPGPHNLENALAAVAMAKAVGIGSEAIAGGLREFRGVEHRIEFVREVKGVRYINDSKGTNVDSSIKAVQTMDRPTVIIAGGYDKKTDFTPFIESFRGRPIKAMVTLGATAEQLMDTAKRLGYEPAVRAESLEDALRKAAEMAGPGENVLLSPACASFDMFTSYEERGEIFKFLVGQLKE
ncbi:UDP-N-acetylmuramoyl-L-alanine--D-glutamate ligase [Gehongia tenuis]|uniref:UDP-N-acetylmuramoylalanine--D-glutamate ligase n=1 Tax=Gehongia tenuis TaxID=2763655 RepID=A0A926D3G5_9FIRM|nr:UDP-N-acetylmuramoyl-L-alanine--D-glutamate ligase [Gehongia tenuis]MBC8530851.1 UDP-N-acetylmuramoyl-L-alanine--D-glutamate ligase [Gehongia tenuis]